MTRAKLFYEHFIGIKGFKIHLSPKYFLFSSNTHITVAVHLGNVQLSAFFVKQGGLRNGNFS